MPRRRELLRQRAGVAFTSSASSARKQLVIKAGNVKRFQNDFVGELQASNGNSAALSPQSRSEGRGEDGVADGAKPAGGARRVRRGRARRAPHEWVHGALSARSARVSSRRRGAGRALQGVREYETPPTAGGFETYRGAAHEGEAEPAPPPATRETPPATRRPTNTPFAPLATAVSQRHERTQRQIFF